MSERITATEAARSFSDLLNRVRYERQTFVIVRGGEEVGRLAPAQPSRPVTLRGLVELLRKAGEPDPQLADDLEEIQAAQPPADDPPWPS
jgi:prevent-host-death family protein